MLFSTKANYDFVLVVKIITKMICIALCIFSK